MTPGAEPPRPADLRAPARPSDLPASGEAGGVWTIGTTLLRHRRVILATTLGLALLVGLASFLTPRRYTSSASFVPQEPMPAQGMFSQLAAQYGFGGITGGGETSPQFYASLLGSNEILRQVVTHRYEVDGFEGTLLEYFEIGPDESYAAVKAVEELRDIVSVDVDRVSSVVRIEVHTKRPALSAAILTRMLALVSEYNLERRQSQARAEREFVERRLSDARAELAQAEEALAAFYRSNRRFEESPELVAQEARLQREVSLRQELFLTLSQSFETARIEEVRSTPVITVVDRPEATVQPRPRGTIRKALIALIGGGFLGLILAFGSEYLELARRTNPGAYGRFVAAADELKARLRPGRARRARSADAASPDGGTR